MASLMKKVVSFLAVLLAAPWAALADISYPTAGSSYTQNFNSLAQSGSNAWTNDSTISGWYSTRTAYVGGTGSSATGALYSFGIAGVNPVTDRALGSVASSAGSGGTGTVRTGIAFVNNTGATLNTINIMYDGEQWRNGTNTNAHSLTFDYKTSATSIAITDSGFTSLSALNFTGPIANGASGALDGNAVANRVAGIASQLTGLNWQSGQTLFLRWSDIDNTGTDHGLGIDNFAFTGNIPEPSSIAFLAGLGVIGAIVARRRMIAKRKLL